MLCYKLHGWRFITTVALSTKSLHDFRVKSFLKWERHHVTSFQVYQIWISFPCELNQIRISFPCELNQIWMFITLEKVPWTTPVKLLVCDYPCYYSGNIINEWPILFDTCSYPDSFAWLNLQVSAISLRFIQLCEL